MPKILFKSSGLILLSLLLLAPPTSAQLLSYSGGGSQDQPEQLVEEEQVLDNARSSFADAVGDFVDQMLKQYGREEELRLRAIAKRQLEDFEQAVKDKINELRGDGALTLKEVTEEVGQLRDEQLRQIREALRARAQGHVPPPRLEEYGNRGSYYVASLDYILFDRNGTMEWLPFLGILLTALVLAYLLAQVLKLATRSLARHNRYISAEMLGVIRGPLYITVGLIGLYTGLRFLWLPVLTEDLVNQAFRLLLALALFWLTWNLCGAIADILNAMMERTSHRSLGTHIRVVIRRSLRLLALLAFALLVTRVLFESEFTTLIASLGVIGIILSFAMRGLLQNITASFTLFGDRPFRVGDMIIFKDHWGSIEDIGFRSTRFRNFDGHLFTIPNSELISQAIHNVSARPYVRRRFRLSLPYGTDAARVRRAVAIIKEILEEHQDRLYDEYHVMFPSFGDYDYRLLIQYRYQPPDYWGALEFDSLVNLEIIRRFEEAGIPLALPAHTALMEAADEDRPALAVDWPQEARADQRQPNRRDGDKGRQSEDQGEDA
ncbi:MAG: mechanosensitive ion channel family protein [Candidatus Competibacteraceae bacterium]|nr:mechanosensitive ion channel family protein [Candidatus Competibacteraceae bacterium]